MTTLGDTSGDGGGDDEAQRRTRAQVELILAAVPDVQVWPPSPRWEAEGFDYFFHQDRVLVRDEDVARVQRIIGGRPMARDSGRAEVRRGFSKGEEPIGLEPTPTGLTRLTELQRLANETVHDLVGRVDAELGRGVATPDHLVYVVGHGSGCPANEPEPADAGARPVPKARRGRDGKDVLVHILDSGWFPGSDTAHDWLAGVDGDPEVTYVPGTDQIMSYSGHGTFCAGVLRTTAPNAEVYVERTFVFDSAGAAWESDIAGHVNHALGEGADIISLSAGCYTREDVSSLGFDVILDIIARFKGVVLVAAAGNDADRRPFWPAASPGVIGVGALNATQDDRAHFSNYGGWVDVYAPGTDLVNAFVTGTFTYVEPPWDTTHREEEFFGMARWSGTSFSTPYVAGLIADRMSRTGENARTAAAALLVQAQVNAIPGAGAVLR